MEPAGSPNCLGVAGAVIEVEFQMQGDEMVITEQTVLIEGLQNLRHLLVWDEGVLVSECATGTIYRLSLAVGEGSRLLEAVAQRPRLLP